MLDMLDIAIGFATVMLAVSLVIMSLTQAIVSASALRGVQLRRGVEQLIVQVAPELAKRIAERTTVAAVSESVVRHALISDSAVAGTTRWSRATAIKRDEFLVVLKTVLHDANVKPADFSVTEQRLKEWFDSFMERVSQRFVMNTRWITAVLAIVAAVLMHLDAFDLIRTIQQDKETRTRLSVMAGTLLDEVPNTVQTVDATYRATLATLIAADPALFTQTTISEGERLASRGDAAMWIRANAADRADADTIVTRYDEAVNTGLAQMFDKSVDRAKTLAADLSTAGIDVFPFPALTGGGFTWPAAQRWPGIVVSMFLLSLGAPFWFNTLKNMTSLRSTVAKKTAAVEDQEGPSAVRKTVSLPATKDVISAAEAAKAAAQGVPA